MAARRFERLARVIVPEKLNRGACGLTLPPHIFYTVRMIMKPAVRTISLH